MRKKPKFKGTFKNTASYCGEQLTGDHITSIKDRMPTVNGWKNAFTVQDLCSRLKALYPQETKTADAGADNEQEEGPVARGSKRGHDDEELPSTAEAAATAE